MSDIETTDAVESEKNNDNISSSTLLGETVDENEAVDTQKVEGSDDSDTGEGGEFDYVPSKFKNEDGEPDFEKLAKSYSELEKKIGNKVAPDSIDEYEYEWKADVDFADDDVYNQAKEALFELGLSKEQFQGVMSMYEDSVTELGQALVPNAEVAEQTLKEEWGDNFDSNLVNARKAWDAFASEDMNIDTVGNNPEVIKLLSSIGSQLGEDSRPPASNSAAVGLTEEEVHEIMKSDDYYTNEAKQAKVAEYFAKHS